MRYGLAKIVLFIMICGPIISTSGPNRVSLLEDLSIMFLDNNWKFPLILGYPDERMAGNKIKAVKAFSARMIPTTAVNSTVTSSCDPMLIMTIDAHYLKDTLRNVEAWKAQSVVIALMNIVEDADELKTAVTNVVSGKSANFFIAYVQNRQGNEWQVLSILSTPRFKSPMIEDQRFVTGRMLLQREPYDLKGETVLDITLDFEPYVSSPNCPLNPIPSCDMVGFFIDYFSAAASLANFRYFRRMD